MHWCGQCSGPALHHGTINACWFQTTAALLLLLLAVAQAAWQVHRVHLLDRFHFNRTHQAGQKAWLLFVAVYVALVVSHLATFIFELTAGAAKAPFAAFYDFALVSAWTVALVVAWMSRKHQVALRWRLLSCFAAVVYGISLYVAALAWRPRRSHGKPPALPHAGVHTVVAGVQLALALTAALADFIRGAPPAEEDEALKQALLGNLNPDEVDVEAAEPKKSRSWTSLFGTALVFVWPDDWILQARAVACMVIIIFVRLLNLAVPILYKRVVDVLSDITSGTHPRPGDTPEHYKFMDAFYPAVLLYIVAYFFQGGTGGGSVGLLSNLRQYLWIPITQNAYRRISLDLFSHMLDLDLNYHLKRKTGEVMRVLDRGTSAIQNILSTVIFAIGPQMIDIVLACSYIAYSLQPWIAVIVFITLASYIPLTIVLTEWRGKFRRDLNRLDNAKGAKATDALLNYETVKYFCNEALERNNFAEAIGSYQDVEYRLLASLNALNVAQSLIIFVGMAAGLTVCAKGVADGSLTVGDAVLFVSLVQQLYAPLNYFGTYYRTIQQYMIDMENMFDLLATSPQLQDAPDAKALAIGSATVAFEDCSFEYTPGASVLKGVDVQAEGGQTLALVGATGSGKSTCLRLLFRFYDPTRGRVTIDGQDISRVTQASLRAAMGVVPQDTVLFNDTILYNIRYGRPSASNEEVFAAARAADIHDAIESRFPQGYQTVVGERGLRLSGGEKQRVAFARTILKDPSIMLLDEATSSLDSLTERRIQEALTSLRRDRTTIIVAHRLSTIMDADQIVVMKDGEVAELGTHPELLARNGLYAEMWTRQQEAAVVDSVGSAATSRAASRAASTADLQRAEADSAHK